jgi:hypothetical protein
MLRVTPPSNQAMQPTAGRHNVSLHFMKPPPLQFTLVFIRVG